MASPLRSFLLLSLCFTPSLGFAADEASLCLANGTCYKISADLKVTAGQPSAPDSRPVTRLTADNRIETRAPGSSTWEASPLYPPPPGFTYEQAAIDQEGSMYVRLGGDAKGFNYVGPYGRPVVISSQIRWAAETPPHFTQVIGNPQGSGMLALGEDGSVYWIGPPTEKRGPFSAQKLFPAGSAKNISATGPSLLVQKTSGEIIGTPNLLRGKWSVVGLGPLSATDSKNAVLSAHADSFLEKPKPLAAAPIVRAHTKPRGEIPALPPSASVPVKVDPQKLQTEVDARILRVKEFAAIKAEADKMGVRAYLLGGAAFSATHYVKHDLTRPAHIPADNFNYDYTSIFLPSQDVDLVVDGNAAQAEQLKVFLERNYPHFRNNQSVWEVRLLNDKKDDKDSLFHKDFMDQHSDSASTGLVEITNPPAGHSRVRDLKDWNSNDTKFLRDAADGKISLYFSPLHETTRRFQLGANPPIVEAVRFLSKAFQENLVIDPQDWKKVAEIIADFDPATEPNAYVHRWMELNGRKLLANAKDFSDAWNKLEVIGLRQKLLHYDGPQAKPDGLAAWMKKDRNYKRPQECAADFSRLN